VISVVRGVSAIQAVLYVVLIVIGIAIGYAIWGSTAQQPARVQTLTLTIPGAATTSTVTMVSTVTTIQTITAQAPGLRGEILIGALLPLSGDLASEGPLNRVATEMAIEDLNSYVKSLGLPIMFRLVVEDSATDPKTALEKLQALYARGVRAVVGPMTSAEVRNLKSYADGNKIVVCSQSSTAPDLAVPDYIFRDVPNDRYQGRAIARLMYDYGVRYVYILYRNDAWGKGLADATSARFKEIGGTILANVGYDPKKSDFSAELSAAASTVKDAINRYGASKVGVLLISFEEGGVITAQAAGYSDLMSITWFGSDGTAVNSKILEQAGVQLVKVKHLATIFAPTESPKFTDFVNRFKAKTGELPGTYPATAYDCVWLLGLAIIQAGKYDGEAIRNALPAVAKTYFGVSGWTLLDDNGDRAGGDYDVWAVVLKDGKPSWDRVALVDVGADTVNWFKKI
jgi:branched-chain amino acid transport system substrate-binding protein